MYDWDTPEGMEARRWLTGEYLDQAGYQNPNDRMNRGELPKTYKAEMALNNAANQKYLEWVQNTPEGQEFARLQGSPMYAQRIENTPRPTTKLGPIELPSGIKVEKAPNIYSAAGYTNPEFVREYYAENGGIDNRPWYDDETLMNIDDLDAIRRYYEREEGVPENSINNRKTWEETHRDLLERFERNDKLEHPKTHFEVTGMQPQRLFDAERANNKLVDSYREYMNGQGGNGKIESNGLFNDWVPSKDVNGASNWKHNDAYEIRLAMKPYVSSQDGEVFSTKWRPNYEGRMSSIKSRLDNNKRIDTPEIKEIRKDFFGQQAPESNEMADNLKKQTTQTAPKTFEEKNIERDKLIDKALKANEKVSPSNSAGAKNMSKFWNAGMKYSDGKTLLPFNISPSMAARIGYGIPSLVNDLFVASVPVTLYADMAYNKYRDYQNSPTEEAVRVLQNEGASDEEIRAYLANNFAYDDNPNHE